MDLVTAVLLFLATKAPAAQPHIIYLHGRIVQTQQTDRPQHPYFGVYDLPQIVETFRSRGFIVHSSIRPKTISVSDAADDVVRQVKALIAAGVPPQRITVVGASMGAAITYRASARLQNAKLRFAVLGSCFAENASFAEKEEGKPVVGHFLAVRESSDEMTTPCSTPTGAKEIVVNTGLGHGYIYRPIKEWVDPVTAWAVDPRGGRR